MTQRTLLICILLVISGYSTGNIICNSKSTHRITGSWAHHTQGTVEFNLHSSVRDWVIEIHFDQKIRKLEQWIGGATKPINVIHGDRKIFFIKANGWNQRIAKGKFRMQYIVSYAGDLAPKIHMIALCGTFNTPPNQSPLPPKYAPPKEISIPVMPCDERTFASWKGGVSRELLLPVLDTKTHDWVLELRFDSRFTDIEQWSCNHIIQDNDVYICENKPYNGILHYGNTFSLPYILTFKKQIPRLLEAWFGSYHCKN